MTTNHDAVAALPISSPADQTLTRNVLVKRMPYVLANTDSWSQLVETDPSTGAVIIDIFFLGRVFHLDATDTTTVGDGTSCLVTSGGKRYKLATGVDIIAYSVLARQSTPPLSPAPSIGDAYLVTTGATGAWAGHVDDVAVYTARGWEFITFAVGRFVYVEGTDAYWHKKADGTWVVGFGNQALGSAVIVPSNMQGGGGHIRWIVENLTTNAPPGVVGEGVQYVIGPSPTGAWSGLANQLANGESGVWVVYAPGEGWSLYDKDTEKPYVYDGLEWVTASGNFKIVIAPFPSTGTWTKPSRLIGVRISLVGGGCGSTGGGTTSFGSHCSATGGGISGAGSGTGGDQNFDGDVGQALSGGSIARGGAAGLRLGQRGVGASGTTSVAGGGGCLKWIDSVDLGASELVTVGSAGAGGTDGICIVEQFIEI